VTLLLATAFTASPAPLITHAALIAAGWGYIASWIAEVTKQDGLPKWANTVVADTVVVVTALVVALVHLPSAGNLTWAAFAGSLLWAAGAAVVNHSFFLSPTGIGAKVQTATTLYHRGLAALPAAAASDVASELHVLAGDVRALVSHLRSNPPASIDAVGTAAAQSIDVEQVVGAVGQALRDALSAQPAGGSGSAAAPPAAAAPTT
jgi:hypothetical protein